MKKIIIIVWVLIALCNFAVAKGNPKSELLRKKKKAVCLVEEGHEKVSPQTHRRILALNANLTKIAKEQLKVVNNSGTANAFMRYNSALYHVDMFLTVDVRYSDKKEYYTDKTSTKKYTITIYADEARFVVYYDTYTKRYSLRYSYPDCHPSKRPCKEQMENELCSALAAIEQKYAMKQLKLINYLGTYLTKKISPTYLPGIFS